MSSTPAQPEIPKQEISAAPSWPRVAIIILNWNGLADTLACLESALALDYPSVDLIVCDNGSTDDSVPTIRRQFPSVTVLENRANLGFAQGNNVGIRYALEHGADYFLLLNNDTIVDRQLLKALVRTMREHPKAGVLGAKIYYHAKPEVIWYAGSRWNTVDLVTEHLGANQTDNGKDWEEVRPTYHVCGCALFSSAAVARRVGLLDPRYFLIWEETDWCERVRKAGYECLVAPQAKLWHKVSASFTQAGVGAHARYYDVRNRLLFMRSNYGLRYTLTLFRRTLWKELWRELRRAMPWSGDRASRRVARAALAGYRDFVLKRFGQGPAWISHRS